MNSNSSKNLTKLRKLHSVFRFSLKISRLISFCKTEIEIIYFNLNEIEKLNDMSEIKIHFSPAVNESNQKARRNDRLSAVNVMDEDDEAYKKPKTSKSHKSNK